MEHLHMAEQLHEAHQSNKTCQAQDSWVQAGTELKGLHVLDSPRSDDHRVQYVPHAVPPKSDPESQPHRHLQTEEDAERPLQGTEDALRERPHLLGSPATFEALHI